MTLSDAFPVRSGGGMPLGNDDTAEGAPRLHARMRAREYPSPSVLVNRVGGWFGSFGSTAAADLREAWWTPASLPTVQKAWANRMPDRSKVPGEWPPLYWGWVAYNHAVALPLTIFALAGVGALSMLTWALVHPARFAITTVIAVATIALIFG